MCKFTINNSSLVSPKRPPWRTFAALASSLCLALSASPSLPPPRIHLSWHHYLWGAVMKDSHFQCFLRPSVIVLRLSLRGWADWMKHPAVMENESGVVACALTRREKQGKWKSPRLARLYIYRQKTWFQISHAWLAADTYCTPGEVGRQAAGREAGRHTATFSSFVLFVSREKRCILFSAHVYHCLLSFFSHHCDISHQRQTDSLPSYKVLYFYK